MAQAISRARCNVLVLAIGQAQMVSAIVLAMTLAGIIGAMLGAANADLPRERPDQGEGYPEVDPARRVHDYPPVLICHLLETVLDQAPPRYWP